jgi:hypothetical protein
MRHSVNTIRTRICDIDCKAELNQLICELTALIAEALIKIEQLQDQKPHLELVPPLSDSNLVDVVKT